MEDNFNVANPTKENIEYAIKNLLFYVTASASIEEYKQYKALFSDLLVKISNVLVPYFKNGNLKSISKDDLQDVVYDLLDLEVETQGMDSYYSEWALQWGEAIMTLRQSEINLGGVINGKR